MVNMMMKVLLIAISLLTFFLCIESWILRLPCKTEADFSIIVSNFKLTNNLIAQITTNNQQICVVECVRNVKCESLNYKEEGGEYDCELNGMTKKKAEGNFKAEAGWRYLSTNYNTTRIGSVCESLNPCDDDYCVDACNEVGYKCVQCAVKDFVQPFEPYCNLEVQGFNCMDLKKMKNDLSSGYYQVWMDSTKKEKIRVFCDMETDGGGWTEILRVKSDTSDFAQFLTTPFKRWVDLNGFAAQGNYMIEPSELSKSNLVSDGVQFRFECKLPSLGKHIHLVTTKDEHGKAVVSWLTGKSDTRPTACQSFKPLQSDSSYLTSHCSDWGYNKGGTWGIHSTTIKERFIRFTMYIGGKVHWGLFQGNRFECDNYRGNKIATKDSWQIFVR